MQALWRTIGGSILDKDFEAALTARAGSISSIQLFLEIWDVEGSTPMTVLAPIQRIFGQKKNLIRKSLDELQAGVAQKSPAASFDAAKDASAVLGLAVCSHIFAWRLHQHTGDLPTFRHFVRTNHLQSFDYDNAQIDLLHPLFADTAFVSKLEEFMLIAWRHPKANKTWALCDGSVTSTLHAALTAEAAKEDVLAAQAKSNCDDAQQIGDGHHDASTLFAVDTKELVTVIMDPAGVEYLAEALRAKADRDGRELREDPIKQAEQLQRTLRESLTDVLDVVWQIPLHEPREPARSV